MKDYQYLLFDLDGTLTEPKEGITKSVQYALEAFGIHEDNLDKLVCFIGPPLTESFKEFYGFSQEKAEAARDKYRERYTDVGIFENAIIEGIPELLRDLKAAGKTIALATSKPEVMAVRILEHFGIMSYFDCAVGSGLKNLRDTKAEVIEEVFVRLNMGEEEKRQALMIGDRLHDIRGARACGIDCMGTYVGYAEEGELEREGADYIAPTVEDMRRLLLNKD